MSDKKAYPAGVPATAAGYMPTTHPATYGAVPGLTPYGTFAAQPSLYAAAAAPQGPPPSYDQSLTHPVVGQQVFAPTTAASMYPQGYPVAAAAAAAAAAAGYPLGYAAYSPMQPFFPSYSYTYPGVQPALRSTMVIPNAFDTGARFDGIAQPIIPPPPPGVAPNTAQLAAMAGHNVALTQKKGSFLTGSSDGGYTFW